MIFSIVFFSRKSISVPSAAGHGGVHPRSDVRRAVRAGRAPGVRVAAGRRARRHDLVGALAALEPRQHSLLTPDA